MQRVVEVVGRRPVNAYVELTPGRAGDRRAGRAGAVRRLRRSAARPPALLLRRSIAIAGADDGVVTVVVAAARARARPGSPSGGRATPSTSSGRWAGRSRCAAGRRPRAAGRRRLRRRGAGRPGRAAARGAATRSTAVAGAASADRLCSVEELAGSPTPSTSPPTTAAPAAAGWSPLAVDELLAGRRRGLRLRADARCCARSRDAATARGRPVLRRGRGVDGLRDRGLHDLRAAGRRRGRPHPLLPVLHRGPGVRRRPGALRRRRHAAVGRRRRRRDGSGGPCRDQPVGRPAASTCRRRWARCRSRARCSPPRAARRSARSSSRSSTSPPSARWSPSRCSCGPRSGRPTPRMAETPERDAQLDRPAGPRHRRAARRRPAVAGRARAPGPSSRSPAPASRTSPSSPPGCAACPACSGLEVNISCPNVESRGEVFACDPVAASDVIGAVRAAADPAQPVYAKLSPDVTDIVSVARAVSRRRRRRAVDDQHPARAGHRPRHHAPGPRRGDRRPVRPGDPPGGAALRLAGAPGAAGGADPRHGRHPERPGRPPVRPRRGVRGLGGDGGVQRPLRAGPRPRRAGRRRSPQRGFASP